MNTSQEKPVAINGEVVIRKVMNFNITYDHRFGDSADAVKMLKSIFTVFEIVN